MSEVRADEDSTSPKERRKKLRENQEYFSSKLSELVRYIGFGLVAASFSLLSRATEFSQSLADAADEMLAVAALTGCLVVACDALQMLFGWISNSLAAANKTGDYKPTKAAEFWRLLQNVLFYLKLALAAIGSILLIRAIMMGISIDTLL